MQKNKRNSQMLQQAFTNITFKDFIESCKEKYPGPPLRELNAGFWGEQNRCIQT